MSTPIMGGARAGPQAPWDGAAPAPVANAESGVAVESTRFGRRVVPADRMIRFVRPVVGFHDLDRYVVIEDKETAPILWIQALGAPEVLLPVVDAGLVARDYSVDLDPAEVGELELARAEDARLMLVLTLDPDPSAITVNLRAPIVWNTRGATAMQLVLEDPTLSVHHRVGRVGAERRSNKEVARACPNPPQG